MRSFFQKNKFSLIIIFVLAIAVISRFVFLSLRPIHHDEGMLSYFAYKLATEGSYIYTPQIHGPILFYFQALVFKIFGNLQIRGATAFFGVLLVSVPFLFSKLLGRKRALTIALLLLISPLFLYYSRFLVHTSIVVVFWLLTVLFLFRFFKKFSELDLYFASGALAFAYGTSETSYIFSAILIAFVPVCFLFLHAKFLKKFELLSKFATKNKIAIVNTVLIFILFYIAIYSVGFSNFKSLSISWPNPFDSTTGLGFWLSQNQNHLGNQKWHFYFVLIFLYEPLVAFGSFFSLLNFLKSKQKSIFHFFLIYWSIATLSLYAITAEKFPWLALLPLLPLTILTGYYLGENFGKMKILTKSFFVLLALFTIFISYRLSFVNYDDPKELAVYVQTPESFQDVITRINNKCKPNANDCVLIDQKISWPLSWDFYYNGKLFVASNLIQPDADQADFVFLSPENSEPSVLRDNFTKNVIKLRNWWVPPVCRKINCVEDFARYYFTRQIWGSYGGFDIYLYERQT